MTKDRNDLFCFNDYDSNIIKPDSSITGSGYSTFSGNVVNYAGQTLNDFTGSSGSGYFDAGYIESPNTENFNHTSFSFLVSQKGTQTGEATLLSNIDDVNKSGFCIRFDDYNKLYFKYYLNQRAQYFSCLPQYNVEQNFYNVTCVGGRVSISYFDIDSLSYKYQQSVNIDDNYYLQSNNTWKLGSGEYAYRGYIDNCFLYTGGSLNSSVAQKFTESFYQSLHYRSPISGLVSGRVTGYSGIPSVETGVIYSNVTVTGSIYETGVVRSTFATGILTGRVTSGGYIYNPATGFSGITPFRNTGAYLSGLRVNKPTGFYWYSGYTGNTSATGITGFVFDSGAITITGSSIDQISITPVTGVLSSGSIPSGLRSPDFYTRISGGRYTMSGDLSVAYYPTLLVYQGERLTGENLIEIKYNNDIGGRDYNNQFMPYNNAQLPYSTFLYNAPLRSTGQTTLNINGQNFLEGRTETVRVNGRDFLSFPYEYGIVLQTGYYTSKDNALIYFEGFETDNMPLENSLDKGQTGARGRLKITSTSQYASGPFSEIPLTDTDIFFNGIKIYSGIDYINQGGSFKPINNITGATGDYFAIYNNLSSETGSAYDLSGHHVQINNIQIYENGVEQGLNQYYLGCNLARIKTGVACALSQRNVEIFKNN